MEEKLSDKSLPLIASTSYNVGSNNQFSVPVKIFYPPHMDQNTQYPVLVYVYGGPGFQQAGVNEGSNMCFHQKIGGSGLFLKSLSPFNEILRILSLFGQLSPCFTLIG